MKIADDPGKRGAFFVQSFMSGEQKILLSLEISLFDREIRKQKIRRDHPEWSELDLMHEIMRQAFRPGPVPDWVEKQMAQRVEEHSARKAAGLE